jgi:hypothetical protein
MKTLRQSLIDYEMALLKAIANCRAVPLDTSSRTEAINQLTETLLSPAAIAITLDDLSEVEREALQFLLDHRGRIEEPRFTRQYGTVRPMGAARLERERPWQTPVNPVEGLWYRGLIFKAFQVTNYGSQEIIYIPSDLLALLIKPTHSQSLRTLQITPTPIPAFITGGDGRLRENLFSILVYLQTTPVRLQDKTKLPPKDKQALMQSLLPALLPTFAPAAELEFLLHLGQRTNLLTVTHGRLRPDRDPVRTWLQANATQQVQLLQNAWRTDPTWNDLWHVPGLVPQPTGWENSPLRARSKILGYLEQIEATPGDWLSIDDFVLTIKQIDPDFQRPNGDYDSWYIQNPQGNSLMGFVHWDRVEGALIRYLLTHILSLLEVVELGCLTETDSPTSFRLTPLGKTFLAGHPVSTEPLKKPVFLRADNNFYVHMPAQASLYDRFQLARFAELDDRDSGRAIYHITRTSVNHALKNGVTTDQITAFLTRATNNQTPLKVVETLRAWGARYATAQLEPVTLLRLKHGHLASELRQHPTLGPLLGEALNPTTILVPADNISEVRRLLTDLGYLD